MITSSLLANIFPGTSRKKRDRFLTALNKYLPMYGIDTYLRVCAFLATGGVETDYLRTTVEYASGADYEGRTDLGNTVKGDGTRFRGRGFFQTTGRYNYGRVNKRLGGKLGIDFIVNPARLAEIDVAVESACIFWQENNLSKYADRGDFRSLSAVVNCGNPKAKPNHWAKRDELYQICKKRVSKDIAFAGSVTLPLHKEDEQNQAIQPIATVNDDSQSHKPVALTPSEPTAIPTAEPSTDNSFLNAAFDKNVTSDQIKATLPSLSTRIWRYVARPIALLITALEAGNVAAWLGVIVALAIVVYLIYAHRAELKQLWQTLKNKFVQ